MRNYDIAAFIWPSYTGDEPRTRIFWPEGYGEWQTVKAMTNRGYEGCRWPRIPTWGYVNEADSRVMEMQINCAVSYGVNVFIYDWYWYDNRPFLENCLNDGFLKADNNEILLPQTLRQDPRRHPLPDCGIRLLCISCIKDGNTEYAEHHHEHSSRPAA